MPVRTITCPSGLILNVRGLKTREANLLADAANTRKGTLFDQILKAVTLEVDDLGPYKAPLAWPKVLVGDRFYALVQTRIATYGPDYTFRFQCREAFCRKPTDWELNLETDLTVKTLSEESRATFLNGNRFETLIPSTGRKVVYQLLTGELESKAAQQRATRKDRQVTLSLNARIVEIDGVHPNDKPRIIDDMELADANELLEILDEADCGIETSIEVECSHCGGVTEIELPFDREFWLPTVRKKKSEEGASSASSPSTTGS